MRLFFAACLAATLTLAAPEPAVAQVGPPDIIWYARVPAEVLAQDRDADYQSPLLVGLDYVDLFLCKRGNDYLLVGCGPQGRIVYLDTL